MGQFTIHQDMSNPNNGPPASPNEFGAQEAAAQGQLANSVMNSAQTLAQIAMKRQNRIETIDRVKAGRVYEDDLRQELQTLNETESLIGDKDYEKYRAWGNSRMEEYIAKHPGSATSKAKLREKLSYTAQGMNVQAYKMGTVNQHKFIKDEVDSLINRSSEVLASNPEMLSEEVLKMQFHLDDLADALEFDVEDGIRRGAMTTMYKTTVDSLIAKGHWQAAEKVMTDQSLVDNASPDNYRMMLGDVKVAKHKAIAASDQVESNIKATEWVLGHALEPEVKAQMRTQDPLDKNQSAAQQLFAYSAATGKKPTPEQIDKAFKLDRSTSGKPDPIIRMNDLLPFLKSGMATEDQKNEYVSLLTSEYGPQRWYDNVNGVTRYGDGPPLPEHHYNFLEATDQLHLLKGRRAPEDEMVEGKFEYDPDEPSLYHLVAQLAGVLPSAEKWAEKLPGLGQAQQMDKTQIKTVIEGRNRMIVRSFLQRPGEKQHEGARKELVTQLQLASSWWENPESALAKTYGLNQVINENIAIENKIIASNPSPTHLSDAKFRRNILEYTRQLNNLPPLIMSDEEADAFPPGTIVVDGRRGYKLAEILDGVSEKPPKDDRPPPEVDSSMGFTR